MSSGIPMEHALLLAAALFAIGLAGLIIRRNVIFMLMATEIMMNAAALAFVAGGARWAEPDGQVMFVLVLTLQAAEACVGLALVIQLFRRFRTLDVDAATTMKG
jgi:NADH-quinone oxidoreductase subunit K